MKRPIKTPINRSKLKVGDYLWIEHEYENDHIHPTDLSQLLRVDAIEGSIIVAWYVTDDRGRRQTYDLDNMHPRTEIYIPDEDRVRSTLLQYAAHARTHMELHKRKKSEFDVRLSETRSLLKEMMEQYETRKKEDPAPDGQIHLPYDLVVDNDRMWFKNDLVKMKWATLSDGSVMMEVDRGDEMLTLRFDNLKEAEEAGWSFD